METVSLSATVTGKKLQIGETQSRYLVDCIRLWADGPVTVTVKRERAPKSTLQMGYYRGCQVPMIVEEICGTSDDPEETLRTHLRLKAMLLPTVPVDWTDPVTGEIFHRDVVPSLSDLNTKEMSDFSERVNQWALDFFGLVIPEPDPAWKTRQTKGQPIGKEAQV